MATAAQIGEALKRMIPATAGADFYNSVMPGGVIQAPSMLAFDGQPPTMDATGSMPSMPMEANAAMTPMAGSMAASGAAGGPVPVSGQVVLAPQPVPPVPRNRPALSFYTIRKGDTLSEIAQRFGTTVADLAKKNGIKNPNKIIAGKQLKL